MPGKKSYITVTDQFCGAGGSSHGIRNYAQRTGGGIEIEIALNHWKLAVDTHNQNFPNTYHECTDVSNCDPRRYISTDMLITSPECTNHSLAKGQKRVVDQLGMFDKGILDPAAERSRATMWDVPRFAEYHDYNIIIVENVVDARKWRLWDSWILAMKSLDYEHECVYLNSMFCHPTPQSRDRLYVVFWKRKNKKPNLKITPLAFCQKCDMNINAFQSWKNNNFKWGRYGERNQYVYRCPRCISTVTPYYYAAFNAIDWSNPGTRIGDRKKPLSPNTIKRIEFGIEVYGDEPLMLTDGTHYLMDPAIFIKNYGGNFDPRNANINSGEALHTITTQDHHALLRMPFVIQGDHSKADPAGKIKDVLKPIQTQTTRQTMGIVLPFIIEHHRTGKARRVIEPLSTILAQGNHHSMVTPFIIENKGQSKSRKITDPLACFTAKSYHGIISDEAWSTFLSYNYNGNQVSHVSEALDTITTKDRISAIRTKPKLEDCYYRMLNDKEVQRGMAFDDDYIILGTQRDKVKQCGNAVTPPAMELLGERCIETLK